jgi:hypothetical protein
VKPQHYGRDFLSTVGATNYPSHFTALASISINNSGNANRDTPSKVLAAQNSLV